MKKVLSVLAIIILAIVILANVVSIITSIGCGASQDGTGPADRCEEVAPLVEAACPGLESLVDKSESDIALLVVTACPDAVPFIKLLCPHLVDQIDRQTREMALGSEN